MAGTVRQISVKVRTPGERGLPKKSVDSAFVGLGGLVGDYNVYRHEEIEDDPDSAVLIMPIETVEELNAEGWPVKPGDLGENLTTSGIPYSSFSVGKAFTAGEARLQISRACEPCDNLFLLPYVRSRGQAFLKTMLGRRGWYARVVKEGWVKAGDPITEARV
ncbi:MAG: MOSC domain-containing protein [Nitrososphaerota archaeon]|nr:MOSC domain-containing protein [Nitrososphaerota archaeon]